MKATDRCVTLMALSILLMLLYTFSLMNHTRLHLIENDVTVNITSHGHTVGYTNNDNIPPRVNIYNITKQIADDFRCVNLQTTPSTPVCIHPVYNDMYISHDLVETGLWEQHVLFDFVDTMQRDPALGVIDLGANIGVYTLVGAAMGRRVVAVEPFMANIVRLHAASQRAGTSSQITLLHNGVSNCHGNSTIRPNGSNQGDVRIQKGVSPCVGSCPETISMITLDDIVDLLPFQRAVIKIDIQGYEHLAFQHAQNLLNALFIPCIYMEWTEMKKHQNLNGTPSKDNFHVIAMLKLLYSYQYVPYTLDIDGAMNLRSREWGAWPDDIVWRLLPNDEEKTQILKNHYKVWPS